MIIKNALVFTDNSFIRKDIYIEKDRISNSPIYGAEIIEAEGLYAIPGLIDLHFHGCVGHDFSDGTPKALQAIANYEAYWGITGISPATMTLGYDQLSKIFKTLLPMKIIKVQSLSVSIWKALILVMLKREPKTKPI